MTEKLPTPNNSFKLFSINFNINFEQNTKRINAKNMLGIQTWNML